MMASEPRTRVDLSENNSLAVPSEAEFFYKASSVDDIKVAQKWATQCNKALSVLGGGSNVLLAEYIPGLVLQPDISGKTILEEGDRSVLVQVGAGENWHAFTQWCLDNAFYGLENLSLIPGSVGASPIQNIGAYGVEVSSLIDRVQVFDLNTEQSLWLVADDCRFSYRESLFKQKEGQHYIVLNVVFNLRKKANVTIHYPALRAYFQHNPAKGDVPTPREVAEAVMSVRRSKLPDVGTLPNAGSFFKNPMVSAPFAEALSERYPSMPTYDAGTGKKKLAAAWLIDQAGWKGRSVNDISVHTLQALVVVNPKRKPLSDILHFATQVREDITQKFDVELEIEPQQLRHIWL